MKGVPTPDDAVAAFRAHFLLSGNASASARAVGIPDSTGRDIAAGLQEDPSFSEARRLLRAQYLEELVAARQSVVRTSLRRFNGKMIVSGGDGPVIDKRADYGKLVLDAEKNAHNLARLDSEKAGEIRGGGDVTIHVSPTAKPEDAGEKTEG